MRLLNLFIAFLIIVVNRVTMNEQKLKSERISPSLRSRLRLYSLYSRIPLINETDQFMEFTIFHNMSEKNYEGKIVEFDTFGWLNGNRQTIFHKLPYIIANPSFRKPHISKDWCDSADFFSIGFRIHQTIRESGLPYHVKCASCHPLIEGLNQNYYLLPERDFHQIITKLAIGSRIEDKEPDYCSRADCEQNPRVARFQEYLNDNEQLLGEWTRWGGEHATTVEDREVQGEPDGELAIHSRNQEGYSTMCGIELNGKVISSNVIVNGDTVGDRKGTPFTYENYESLNIIRNSVQYPNLNLELFISWDSWGCCSACCCSAAICGHELQVTTSECENLFSARSRTGHLSIRKLNGELINVTGQNFIELSKLLSTPPYTRRGVQIFSSILRKTELKGIFETIQELLIPQFLAENNNDKYQFTSGMFVMSESCKTHIQKKDCYEWARCHNISLSEAAVESSVALIDPCQQVQFVDVLVGVEHIKVTVGEHQNLRIRMDSEVHDMNKTKAMWRVNLRKPKKYDKSRPCLLQGLVQRVDEILILNFEKYNLKIDLILQDRKVRVTFVNSRGNVSVQVVKSAIFYWAAAITVFFVFLIISVVLIHREKTRRMEQAIRAALE